MNENKKRISRQELEENDGSPGTGVYIGYRDRVVDVGESKLWKGGKHMNRHSAGSDLTRELANAPHGEEVLDRYPQVGQLEEATEEEDKEASSLPWLLRRFPFLQRHPHPMTVHFPLALAIFAPLFLLLRLATGHLAFGITTLHCLGAGIVFTPVAIATGLYTWWLNFLAQRIRQVVYKLFLTPVLFLLFLATFLWRLFSPELLQQGAWGAGYVLLVLLLAPLAGSIGWFGATLTFPVEKD